mmetsp:Transcript_36535/g.96627  ORF Transcript_36535/g.96627 Transcript_36535/m.96627 type:complete len:270 (-) Transcript_36535:527-1336(-)
MRKGWPSGRRGQRPQLVEQRAPTHPVAGSKPSRGPERTAPAPSAALAVHTRAFRQGGAPLACRLPTKHNTTAPHHGVCARPPTIPERTLSASARCAIRHCVRPDPPRSTPDAPAPQTRTSRREPRLSTRPHKPQCSRDAAAAHSPRMWPRGLPRPKPPNVAVRPHNAVRAPPPPVLAAACHASCLPLHPPAALLPPLSRAALRACCRHARARNDTPRRHRSLSSTPRCHPPPPPPNALAAASPALIRPPSSARTPSAWPRCLICPLVAS